MIEVITGPMFSGKTEELIRRIEVSETLGLKCIVFKPEIESRNESENNAVATHDQKSKISATPVKESIYITRLSKDFDVIAIDEAQFFDTNLYLVIKTLHDNGKWVIVSGLDMDYNREPFDTMANVLAVADSINKFTATCSICKNPAQYSKRIIKDSNRVLIGSDDKYAPQCHKCYNKE